MNNAIKIFGFLAIFLITLTSCEKLEETGIIATQSYTVSEFQALDIISAGKIIIRKGESSVYVEADQAVLDALDVGVRGDELTIKLDRHYHFIDIQSDIVLYINTPNMEDLKVRGATNIVVEDEFDFGRLTLDLDGEHRFTASGTATQFTAKLTGENTLNCFDLTAQNLTLKTLGESTAEIRCENYLDVNLAGEGEIFYKGHPDIDQSIIGEIRLIDAN